MPRSLYARLRTRYYPGLANAFVRSLFMDWPAAP